MLLFFILYVLISNAVTLRRDLAILFNRATLIIIIYLIIQNFTSLFFLDKTLSIFNGLLSITNITQHFHIFIFIISALIIQLTSFYPLKLFTLNFIEPNKIINNFTIRYNKILNRMGEHLKIIEYPLIILFIISGALFLISTNDLISIFLSIELQSYGLYLLSTIYRDSEFSTTGGLIYFLLGGLSSCFILLGISLIYINSGTTNLDGIYIISSISDIGDNINL
jgi:NADH-ubiquinone oxidoreductase chain 2